MSISFGHLSKQPNLGSGNVPRTLVFGSKNFPLWLGERSRNILLML